MKSVSYGELESRQSELGARSRRALLSALVVGLVGAGLLTLYLRRFEEQVSGGRRVAVLGLLKPVARGALVSDDALTVFEVPLAYVERRAVKQADRQKIVGVRATNALVAQDTLLWSDLALASEQHELASLVQPGKRAVTVRASEAGSDPAGNGLVHPGDYVDVVVTLRDPAREGSAAAVVLLQRVLVLAVGSETQPVGTADGQERATRGSQRELTLSLKMDEVQLLSLARERGTLSVALRAPTDSKIVESIPDVALSSLYDKLQRELIGRPNTTPTATLPVRVPSVTR